MNMMNFHYASAFFAIAFCAGCINGGHVVVTGGEKEDLEEFDPHGGIETPVGGSSVVLIGSEDISSNVGVEALSSRDSVVKVGNRAVTASKPDEGLSSAKSSVKMEGKTICAPDANVDNHAFGASQVVIGADPSERAIRGGGLELSPGMAVAVVPPSDTGVAECRDAKRRVYVEVMRQLEKRGCRLASKDLSSARRPSSIDRLEKCILSSGYDIGYNMALAEDAVAAPAAELILEVLDCHIDMVSGKYTVVVRTRKPVGYNGAMKSRSFRSRIPSTDLACAVASLFAE